MLNKLLGFLVLFILLSWQFQKSVALGDEDFEDNFNRLISKRMFLGLFSLLKPKQPMALKLTSQLMKLILNPVSFLLHFFIMPFHILRSLVHLFIMPFHILSSLLLLPSLPFLPLLILLPIISKLLPLKPSELPKLPIMKPDVPPILPDIKENITKLPEQIPQVIKELSQPASTNQGSSDSQPALPFNEGGNDTPSQGGDDKTKPPSTTGNDTPSQGGDDKTQPPSTTGNDTPSQGDGMSQPPPMATEATRDT